MQWCLYIIQCSDKSFYTGITTDVALRLHTHNQGKASKYTRTRLPVELLFTTTCIDKSEALQLERRVKQLSRKSKIEFMSMQGPVWGCLLKRTQNFRCTSTKVDLKSKGEKSCDCQEKKKSGLER